MPPHVLMNFRGFPPGCGDSVADFWGWDAHEARLRCPDDVSGDMQEDEIPGGALSLSLLTTQTMVTTGIFPCNSHGRTRNSTRDLMISRQRPWPLDYEAGLKRNVKMGNVYEDAAVDAATVGIKRCCSPGDFFFF